MNYKKHGLRMMNYFDTQFVSDPLWCFYVLDISQRHSVNRDSNYFVNNWLGKFTPTISDIKK